MKPNRSITRWIVLLMATLALAACDAEIKVDTDTPVDTSGVAGDDSDTVVTGGGLGDGESSDGSKADGGTTSGNEPGDDGDGDTATGGTTPGGTTPGGATPASRNIRVLGPRPGERITNARFTLRGEARTFENTVAWRVRAADRSVLAEGFTTATGEMGVFSSFSTTVALERAYSGAATIEVYQNSAKDGTEIDKVTLPVTFAVASTDARNDISVFFTNAQRNPGAADCSRVFAAARSIASTSGIARAAVEELLRGPTAAERAQSFDSEIPAGTRLRDITIIDGVARADFSRELNTAAGSCRVTAVRAQIERTLRQFPSVRRVIISVEGNSAEALQP